MPRRNFLFIPGPTNVPVRVHRALFQPQEDQRAPDFPQFVLPLFADLNKIFRTETGQIFVFPDSGHRQLGGLHC